MLRCNLPDPLNLSRDLRFRYPETIPDPMRVFSPGRMEHGTGSDGRAGAAGRLAIYCAGSVIDARSGLTADDIDLIIADAQALAHIGEAVEHSLDA